MRLRAAGWLSDPAGTLSAVTNLEILETLGLELRRRGRDWRSYLPPLRVLYAHTRAGTTPAREEWPLEHALDLAGLLGIGPNPWPLRPWNSACPHCPTAAEVPQHFGGMRKASAGALIDRSGERCLLCGFCWAEPRANFVFSKADRREELALRPSTSAPTHDVVHGKP